MVRNVVVPVLALLAFIMVTACDNQTKEKIIGYSVISAGNTGSGGGGSGDQVNQASIARSLATMAQGITNAGGVASFAAPALAGLRSQILAGLPSDTDGDGWYEYTGMTNTEIEIKLLDAAGNATGFGPGIKTVLVRIHSTYAYGAWSGEFSVDNATDIMSGTITAADPVGGSFVEVLSNIAMDQITINGQPIGIPADGTSTLTAANGAYTGICAYGKTGSVYTHTGTIYHQGTAVATVNLVFNSSFGNYTGTYTDASGTHVIE